MEEKNWYAVYTRGRWEKKVHAYFQEEGIESYCPLNIVRRKWSDRVKKVEEPLFKSYVFVRISPNEFNKVRQIDGVVNFVYWLGTPGIIKDKEIEEIRRFMLEYDDVTVESISSDIKPGNKLVITGGVLMDKNATALKVFKNKVEVLIESIGFKLVATVNKSILEKM